MEIIQKEKVGSTNSEARSLLLSGKYSDWTVVCSREQESGHGKQNSYWYSPRGGLYFSIIIPKTNIKDVHIITILSSFAIADILKRKYDIEPMIKIPNDIYLNGKKFCGVLTENIISGENISSIIGIGINTNIEKFPDNLNTSATSLFNEIGELINNDLLIEEIVAEIKKYFKEIIS